jgi:hypothetical protein
LMGEMANEEAPSRRIAPAGVGASTAHAESAGLATCASADS